MRILHAHRKTCFTVYRPPSTSVPAFVDELELLLTVLVAGSEDVCVLGDFNLHQAPYITQLNNLLSSLELTQSASTPTHKSVHILDFVIVRDGSSSIGTP